ncbi:MAG: DUF3396 domain-containing protein [Deltaproteobacteria bacterium]|nr:DUF3396 domain-containing protein [Deltaproteobacteria bacterium]
MMKNKILLLDDNGDCLARDNIVIAFFGKYPFSEMVEGAKHCVKKFLEMTPSDALKWSIIGKSADTYKPLSDKALARCLSTLTVAASKKKDIHFRLFGPEVNGPDYGLTLNGKVQPSNEGFLNQTNVVEMRFPRELLSETGEDAFVEIVTDLFKKIPCDSGYASIALCFGDESKKDIAGKYIAPIALRSHGYDIPDNLPNANALGDRCRGARWLTILSHKLIDELGGLNSMKQVLSDGVETISTKNGVLFRAGATPEIGDVNRNQFTPLLASVAHVIEKITYFGDNTLRELFGFDSDKLNRWERRFWHDRMSE